MIILGINGGHDASITIIKDNKILGVYEKERFTRVKHDSGDVSKLLPGILKVHGIEPSEISIVATTEPVHKDTEAGYRLLSGAKYKRPDQYSHHIIELNGFIYPAVSVAHHLCHAAYSFYTSDFNECAAITWDGGGDFYTEDAYSSTTVSYWKDRKFQYLERIDNCDFGSLWFMYANSIFGDGNHSGKLMGLAAYGSDRLLERFYDRFTATSQGTFGNAKIIKNCWPDYYNTPFYRLGDSWEAGNTQDIAFAVQALTTTCGLDICKIVKNKIDCPNLVLGGGVALNGYLNSAIGNSNIFEKVFIPPAVHDGGLSLGAALFVAHNVIGESVPILHQPDTAFLGGQYKVGIEDIEIGTYLKATQKGISEAAECAARLMAEGKVVAWYEGRSEHGPRALGHRSMLASPVIKGIKDHINKNIKKRELFRPLAPVVLEDYSEDYFDLNGNKSHYMMDIVGVKANKTKALPEITHEDGTARVQTVNSNSSFGQILNHLKSMTDLPIAINTSLNASEPIVETPTQALRVFNTSDIQAIFLNGVWVEKKV